LPRSRCAEPAAMALADDGAALPEPDSCHRRGRFMAAHVNRRPPRYQPAPQPAPATTPVRDSVAAPSRAAVLWQKIDGPEPTSRRWLIPINPSARQFQCDCRAILAGGGFFACRQCSRWRPRSSPGPRPDPNTPHRTANDFQLQSETRPFASPSRASSGRACSTSEHVIAYYSPKIPQLCYPVLTIQCLAFSALMTSRRFPAASIVPCGARLAVANRAAHHLGNLVVAQTSTSCNTKTVR